MRRRIENELKEWKEAKDRKVLLVRGARQVGKTYSVRNFGKVFEYFLEVNLEKEQVVHKFFEGSLKPSVISEKLSAFFGIPILAGRTLLFFDEIQACPNALRALRFYQEDMPDLHVVSAGSLLEFVLSEIPSFGVGRISNLFMYPMTFSEFLWASDAEALHALILKASGDYPLDPVFHQELLGHFRKYQVLGGMPAVIRAYREGTNLQGCQEIIDGLLTTLRDDFAKYKKRAPVLALREVFESIAHQAGGKFKFSNISGTGHFQVYKDALELLVQAGLAYKIYHTGARGIPLGAQINPKRFKVIPFDLGVHERLLGLSLSEHIIKDPMEMVNKGSLAEVFVGLEIIAHASSHIHPELFYWHRESPASNAEVDYLIQLGGRILPIEVKAGSKGQMQSLFLFLEERRKPFGIRISHENFGVQKRIYTIPIYAVERIPHVV